MVIIINKLLSITEVVFEPVQDNTSKSIMCHFVYVSHRMIQNCSLFLGPMLAQKLVSAYNDNPFNGGFWAKISIFFFS